MRFRDMTLRFARSVSVFSCLWLGVLTAAAPQVGGQIQASSSDASRANAVAMPMPGELPESPGAVHAQELGSTQSRNHPRHSRPRLSQRNLPRRLFDRLKPPLNNRWEQPPQKRPRRAGSLLRSRQESPSLPPNSDGFA
jgi:hypothetical protein